MTTFHVFASWPTPWMTIRTVTHVTHRPCQRPVRVGPFTGSPLTVLIDCGRRLPADQQCGSCRHTIAVQPQLVLPPAAVERAAS